METSGRLIRHWMNFHQQVPREPLGLFIEHFWFYEGLSPAHRLERVFPDATFELVINLKDEPRHVFDPRSLQRRQTCRRSWISGAHSRPFVIDTARNSSMMGAHFRLGGASALLGMPAAELADQVVDLDDLWGPDGPHLRDALLEARNVSRRFAILEDFLLGQWRRIRTRDQGVRWLPPALDQLTSDPPEGIGDIASRLGLSHKHFIECFRRQVGMTPKRFARVRRFQKVLRRLDHDDAVQWAEVALECGYYDQAHFINDFKAFSGLNPESYLQQRSGDLKFLPIQEG